MALINCPECGKQISDKSEICVACGFPIREYLSEKDNEKIEDEKHICPYCGEPVFKGDDYCDGCGMRLTDYINTDKPLRNSYEVDFSKIPYTVCPQCGRKNKAGIFSCSGCGYKYKMNDYIVIAPKVEEQEFNGIYKYTVFNGKQEVHCPRCGSVDCSHYKEQKYDAGKTKTSYTMNINPLRPFTLFNKKEKVVREPHAYTENKIICNSCGKIFK